MINIIGVEGATATIDLNANLGSSPNLSWMSPNRDLKLTFDRPQIDPGCPQIDIGSILNRLHEP